MNDPVTWADLVWLAVALFFAYMCFTAVRLKGREDRARQEAGERWLRKNQPELFDGPSDDDGGSGHGVQP